MSDMRARPLRLVGRERSELDLRLRSTATRRPSNRSEIVRGKNVIYGGEKPMARVPAMLGLFAIGLTVATGSALADTKDKKIAFSNNYAGNSWRQAMLKSYDIVTKKAVADGAVAAADVFTTADKEVPTQAAQIQNLILQGY